MGIHNARHRRLPIGAELLMEGGVHFRVWAPRRQRVQAVIEGEGDLDLHGEGNGYFSGLLPHGRAGLLYRYRLDGERPLHPDPASRFQPEGPHGPSRVVDPGSFIWSDGAWRGVTPENQVLYEMHVGTFTPEGTWEAAMRELPELKALGITCVEVMPVADFPGRFGWGYDGVNLFAPTRLYGGPDEMRKFVNLAHEMGMGVILDVVYNHLGPDGNCLAAFSDTYFSPTHRTDWGDAMNFGGAGSAGVREFYLSNARHWIEEYHLDGFRFDATQAIVDGSPQHILAEVAEVARRSGGGRRIYLVNENGPQDTRLVRPVEQGGYGMDALWNDDFHHSAVVAITGRNEGYYVDYLGTPQELLSAAKWGYLFQGQRSRGQRSRRGTPSLDLPPTAFVHFIENHDQVANSARGLRIHQIASPGEHRAMTALLLLMPQTPMLFQGQEYGASAPFLFFADHNSKLGGLVRQGRAREIAQFPSAGTPAVQAGLDDPTAEETFLRCKLDRSERAGPPHACIYQMHKDLLQLRRDEAVFRRVQRRGDVDGAVLGPEAFVLRFFGQDGDDRLLAVNFGRDLSLDPVPEPLLAPPSPEQRWSILWSSEDPRYGGAGTAPPDTEVEGWWIQGRCAVVLRPVPAEEGSVHTRIVAAGSTQDAKCTRQDR